MLDNVAECCDNDITYFFKYYFWVTCTYFEVEDKVIEVGYLSVVLENVCFLSYFNIVIALERLTYCTYALFS